MSRYNKYCELCKNTIFCGQTRVNHCKCSNAKHLLLDDLVEKYHVQKSTSAATTKTLRNIGYKVNAPTVYKSILRNPKLQDFYHGKGAPMKKNILKIEKAEKLISENPNATLDQLVACGISRYQAKLIKKKPRPNDGKTPLLGDQESLKNDIDIYIKEKAKNAYPFPLELVRVAPNVLKYRDWIKENWGIEI
jgi:hypothetical protein